jgi:hypothetical protein
MADHGGDSSSPLGKHLAAEDLKAQWAKCPFNWDDVMIQASPDQMRLWPEFGILVTEGQKAIIKDTAARARAESWEPFWVGPGPDGSVRVARQRLRLWDNPASKRLDRRKAAKKLASDIEERDARFRGLDTIRCIEIAPRTVSDGIYLTPGHGGLHLVIAEDGRHSRWASGGRSDPQVVAHIVTELGLS